MTLIKRNSLRSGAGAVYFDQCYQWESVVRFSFWAKPSARRRTANFFMDSPGAGQATLHPGDNLKCIRHQLLCSLDLLLRSDYVLRRLVMQESCVPERLFRPGTAAGCICASVGELNSHST